MAQFDLLIILPLVWGLLAILLIYFNLSFYLITKIVKLKKLRIKILKLKNPINYLNNLININYFK